MLKETSLAFAWYADLHYDSELIVTPPLLALATSSVAREFFLGLSV